MRNPGRRTLTDRDLRTGEELEWQFAMGQAVSETDQKFSLLCRHAKELKARLGRNPTIDEARAELADNDFLLSIFGTVADARERAALLQIEIVPVIELPEKNMVLALALCGVHPHVTAASCYAWRGATGHESTPGSLVDFETVRDAVKRQPGMAEVIAAARTMSN